MADKSGEKSLGEPDRVVVLEANLHPHECEFGMVGRPLGQEHCLSCSGRRDDKRQRTDERLVEPASEGYAIDRVGRRSRCWDHGFSRSPAVVLTPVCHRYS